MDLLFKTGLKLYSTNTSSIPEARKLYEQGYFDYIELYIVPGSYAENFRKWKDLGVKYMIHAPHSFHDVNLAQAAKRETNLLHFVETQRFADTLNSGIIIVHGGNNGAIDETIAQIKMLDDSRIALENKPRMGLHGELCVCWSPDEFRIAADAGVLSGTALDFGHAIYAARSSGREAMDMIREFMSFEPKIFHLSDGDSASEKDLHYNLGDGDFNISELISFVPEDGLLTLETPRAGAEGLNDFVRDAAYLKKLTNLNTGGVSG